MASGSVQVLMPKDIPARDDYFVVRKSLFSFSSGATLMRIL
jgi:hypothetical protein